MTARTGSYISGGGGEKIYSSARSGRRRGFLAAFSGNAISSPTIYKNEGYYAAGGVWETWITVSDPSTTPPSGHTLTHIQHLILR